MSGIDPLLPISTNRNLGSQSDPEPENGDHQQTGFSTDGNFHSSESNITFNITQENQASNTIADSKHTAPSTQGPMSVPSGKPNGGPSTPTVKKILSSGTFGAGSVKATGSKATPPPAAAVPKAVAPPLKKPATSAPAATSRPAMSLVSSKPAAPAPSTRRASVVPTKSSAPPAPKASLAASTRPASDAVAAVRNSAVSPTGSIGSAKGSTNTAARPRASVSDAVKKAPLVSRLSLVNPARPVAPTKASTISRSSAAPPGKSSKVPSSISSIKEIKEDISKEIQGNPQALADLKIQLEGVTESLKSKNDSVLELESQIRELGISLAAALADVEVKTASMAEAESTKTVIGAQFQETQTSLNAAQEELLVVNASLSSTQKELEEAKRAASAQDTLIGALNARIQELEATLSSSQDDIKALEHSREAVAVFAAEAASVERERLLQAQANLEAISEETENLKATYKESLEKATRSEEQVASLKSEKEDNANKLSELEIEILELKETQEGLEDTRDTLQRQIITLEGDIAKSAVSSALAVEAASGREEEYLTQLREQVKQHEQELATRSERYAEIVASLESLKAQHADVSEAYERSKQQIASIEQTQASKLSELEQVHAAQRNAQSAEFAKIKAALDSQEAIYNSKIDVVKAEYAQLLQDGFEQAKQEADNVHAQELQSLRAASNGTIQQIQAANQAAVEALKADHHSTLENESNALNKQISVLTLELKATQDDLSKTKATLEISRSEMSSLSKQRDEARSLVDAGPALSAEHAEEIARLTKELANAKDDLSTATDMLNLTKSSLSEMSDRHTRELEEDAKSHANEVIKLKSTYDSEVATLATQKSEALIKLLDLEGELATVKATLATQQNVVPKSTNGLTQPQQQNVTKEELMKMHEAHNLKIYDLQAEQEKALNTLREEVEAAKFRAGELEQEVGRKAMEIQYLEQDQDESQEQISRLKEDVDNLTGRLRQASE